MTPPVAGIVLAGGHGRRFGGDKLQVPVGGRPILYRAIEAIGAVAEVAAGGEIIVVVGPGTAVPSLPEGLTVPVRVARDRRPDGGPLVGLLAGLEAAAAPSAILVAGDMPLLVAPVLSRMVAELGARSAGRRTALVEAVVLEGPGGDTPPMPMALRVEPARAAASALLARGRRRLGAILDELPFAVLPLAEWQALDSEGTTLWDVDRPEDVPRIENEDRRRG
jgi:molybdenum cofactor guanylyltransferase